MAICQKKIDNDLLIEINRKQMKSPLPKLRRVLKRMKNGKGKMTDILENMMEANIEMLEYIQETQKKPTKKKK